MTGVPVWLLDIDGVVNPAVGPNRPPSHVWPVPEWVEARAAGLRVLAARPVLDFIRSAHKTGRAEIRWHTSWQERAGEFGYALGLPAFPVQEAPEYHRRDDRGRVGDSWWKLPTVWRLLAEGRRALWTDDDASMDLRPEQRATLGAAGCHVISPDPVAGLCRRHLRMIDEYLPAAVTVG
jgi:hypothetical protein